MAFTNTYDVTFPPDTQLANLLGSDLRALALNVQQRMAAISGLDASKPAFGSDAQPTNWNGVLFFATDTGHIYQFNNPTWTNVTSDFILAPAIKRYTSTGTNLVVPAGVLSVGSIIFFAFASDISHGNSDWLFGLNGAQPGNIAGAAWSAVITFDTLTDGNIVISNNAGVNPTLFNIPISNISTNGVSLSVAANGGQTITSQSLSAVVFE